MKVVTIGRSEENDVTINDAHVSRHHMQIIQHDDGHYSLSDFGSANGTYINGTRVRGEVTLSDTDYVRIGNTMVPWKLYFDTPIEGPESVKSMATLKVIREKKIFGFAISFSVIVDGAEVGILKNGSTLTHELSRSTHTLKITSLEKDVSQIINISNECDTVEVRVSIGMGILAGRPHINDVKYIER